MDNKDLTFEEKRIDTKELTEMVLNLPYAQKKTIHDMIKGHELLSRLEEDRKEPA